MKACYCVNGPPPTGVCSACGAAGPYYVPPTGRTASRPTAPVTVIQPSVSEDRVRQIIREEIAAALKDAQR